MSSAQGKQEQTTEGSNEDEKKEKESFFPQLILIVVGLALIVVFLWYGWAVYSAENGSKEGFAYNNFGDAFGVMSALFSACAFAGMIYAILLQRKELSLQREELKLTRKVLKESAEQQKVIAQATQEQVELDKQKTLKESALLDINIEKEKLKLMPHFELIECQWHATMFETYWVEMSWKCVNAFAKDVTIVIDDSKRDYPIVLERSAISLNEVNSVKIDINKKQNEIIFILEYSDVLGKEYEKKIRVDFHVDGKINNNRIRVLPDEFLTNYGNTKKPEKKK